MQISFQEFKNKLLEPGLVDHIVVSNKSVAKVYVRNTPLNQTDNEVAQGTQPAIGSGGQYKYYFNIGSVESFEEKLEEAQEALGIYSHDFVPVTYSFELGYREWITLASILLLLGFLVCAVGFIKGAIDAARGKGAPGIFNIGKAPVTKVDRNAKNKVGRFLFLLPMRWLLMFVFVLIACSPFAIVIFPVLVISSRQECW